LATTATGDSTATTAAATGATTVGAGTSPPAATGGGPVCSVTYSGAASGQINDGDAVVSTSLWQATPDHATRLVVACGSDDTVALQVGSQTDDSVFVEKAASYTIGSLSGDQEIDASAKIGGEDLTVSPGGKLDITKFDATGLQGTFTFSAAKADGGVVNLSGTFSVGCTTSALQTCK
jgi:hypothetical protein